MKSLAKGLKALQFIAEEGQPIPLSKLADALSTTKSTATRICYTLTSLELLQRNENKKYQLTPNILRLGYAAICAQNWHDVAKFYLDHLFNEVQETVNLCVLEGAEVIHAIRIKKRDEPLDVRTGTRLPVNCTATGKVLMAMGPPEKTIPAQQLIRFREITPHTITNLDQYRRELDLVRKKGFGINYDELSIGTCAVAAPVFGKSDHATASINIVVPTSHYSSEDLENILAPKVVQAAKQISDALSQMDSTSGMP